MPSSAWKKKTQQRPCTAFPPLSVSFFFFFNDTATTEIYTLSLHDALPISTASADAGTGGVAFRTMMAPFSRGLDGPRQSCGACCDGGGVAPIAAEQSI